MARRIAWTEAAWGDLEQAADYIARDSPTYAASLVRQLRDRARSLEEMPERGRVVPELGDRRVRELIAGSYRLIYEMGADEVVVLAVVHGARDLGARLDWRDD